MPSIIDNMSVDEPTVEDNFIDTIVNGSCTDIYQLCARLGDLVRAGHNLSDFIVGSGHGSDYLECFNNCVGENSQLCVIFLQEFANRAGYGNIENYLNSIPGQGVSVAYKLGFGVEQNNTDGVSNGVSIVGNRLRNALVTVRRQQQQQQQQHGE
jgi:hypothetical protein